MMTAFASATLSARRKPISVLTTPMRRRTMLKRPTPIAEAVHGTVLMVIGGRAPATFFRSITTAGGAVATTIRITAIAAATATAAAAAMAIVTAVIVMAGSAAMMGVAAMAGGETAKAAGAAEEAAKVGAEVRVMVQRLRRRRRHGRARQEHVLRKRAHRGPGRLHRISRSRRARVRARSAIPTGSPFRKNKGLVS